MTGFSLLESELQHREQRMERTLFAAMASPFHPRERSRMSCHPWPQPRLRSKTSPALRAG